MDLVRPARDAARLLVPALVLAGPEALAAAGLRTDKWPFALRPMDSRMDVEMILAAERLWAARMRARERLGQGRLRCAVGWVDALDVRRQL